MKARESGTYINQCKFDEGPYIADLDRVHMGVAPEPDIVSMATL